MCWGSCHISDKKSAAWVKSKCFVPCSSKDVCVEQFAYLNFTFSFLRGPRPGGSPSTCPAHLARRAATQRPLGPGRYPTSKEKPAPQAHGSGENGSVKQETSLSNKVQVWQHFTWLKHLSIVFHVQGLMSTLSSMCCFSASGDITFGMDLDLWGKLGASWLLLLVWDWQSDHSCSLRKPG